MELVPADVPTLQQLARKQTRAWYQVQRARVVLAVAAGERVQSVAARMECDPTTVWRLCRRYQENGLEGLLELAPRAGRPVEISPPLQRAQIVQLACLEPIAKGLHITHWSRDELARQAVAEGIVPAISGRTIGRILDGVDWQPHRPRYWKTARLDAQFKQRAERVLWCYANAPRLAKQGRWVVCVDKIPHLQVLERQPIRRAIPSHIEQQEFEYVRHGTVTVLLFLVVHSGYLDLTLLERKDAQHYIQALEGFRQQRPWLNGVFLVQDNDSSHTAGDTQTYLANARLG